MIKKSIIFAGLLSMQSLRRHIMFKTLPYSLLVLLCTTIMIAHPTNNELFENKVILITGGTGYLGRTLAQEILNYKPKKIIILSRDEVKLFNTQRLFNHPAIQCFLGDIRDYHTLLYYSKDVDVVIHAAALKRIDALEDNTQECIRTNVMGSINVFNACINNKVKRVLFISTDKASSPINIYGGCKFISEKIFTNYDYANTDTIFTVVRFGNILESTGSVIPLFTQRIISGQEITLTDKKMTRFVIAKDEAVSYIFDAMRYSIGGEIFIKRLPAMKITDLIDILKEKHNANNTIRTIGLRPGEKIHEVLINQSEMQRCYEFEHLCVITPSLPSWTTYATQNNTLPIYMINGKSLQDTSDEYHSGNAVISRSEVQLLFKDLGII